jgi:uncharacterized membrane protein YdbT with pleckstrin-like domain
MKQMRTTKLASNEKIVLKAKPHWVIFLSAVFWLLVGIFLVTYAKKWQLMTVVLAGHRVCIWLGMVAFTLAVLRGLIAFARYLSAEFVITNKRLLMKEGLIHHHALEVSINKVHRVHIKQSLLGRILNYGLLDFNGAGGKEPFHNVPRPFVFRQKLREQTEE